MRKTTLAVAIGLLLFAGPAASLRADHDTADRYLTMSFFITPFHLGLKHNISDGLYAVGNMDYLRSESDLQFQAGAVYMIPAKILFFNLYGGGGFQFSRNDHYQFPYLTIGTKAWVLFWELNHPLAERADPQYRFGFVISF